MNDKWNGDLDKVKMSVEMTSSQILESSPTEFEPMTFENNGWNALTTTL